MLLDLVKKVEKKLADQTDFFNYKNEMDNWIVKALEILDSCSAKGNVDDIKQQMETINVIRINVSKKYPEKISIFQ